MRTEDRLAAETAQAIVKAHAENAKELDNLVTKAQLARLKADLKKVINEEEDSIVFYLLRKQQYVERQIVGQDKGGQSLVL